MMKMGETGGVMKIETSYFIVMMVAFDIDTVFY